MSEKSIYLLHQIAAAATNNAKGIAAIDWKTKIMPLKVLDGQGTGTTFNVCEGIMFAADLGAKVVNLSLGGYDYSPTYDDAVNYAHSAGCVIVASAGNDNIDRPVYPGSCAHVLCVAATDQDDEKASFSNYGTYIDLCAPGVAILSTLPRGQYTYYNGTSMAAPLVSGLAALITAHNPLFGPPEIESLLVTYADDLGEPGWDPNYGYGRINAYKSLIGPVPVAPGYYGAAVLGDGVANAGEPFGMTVTILNTGDSTAYGVRATLSTSDPYVTISQNFARYGAIPRNRAVVGIDTFMVQFKTNMPKDHAVWFTLTIEDSLGMIFADGFMIKEGEYLPGFIAPMAMKDLVRGYARQGYAVYLPQGNLNYKDFTGTGFAANDLEQAGGEGMSSWYTFEEWWERFGSSCVHMWLMDLPRPVAEAYWQGSLLAIEGQIEAPQDQAAFPIGDTIVIRIHNEARWIEEGSLVIYPWNEELVWNTSEPPNLAGEWIPAAYQMWIEEYDYTRGWIYEADETRIWWLFTLKIRENLVKKYFNPLKPDSARVVYELLPMQYADPDVAPNPIAMQVEVRDKDSVLVYGPKSLSYQEQKSQVLWWNGKDNGGNLVNMENGPFVTVLDLQYGESGKGRAEQHVRKAIKGLFPNLIFVEKIEPIPSQVIELRNYPIGPIYTAHWDQNQNQIIVDPIKPFGDYIEIYEAGKKKLAFSLTLSINSRVPPWQMGAELAGKYSLKIDKYGDIMGQFNGTGFTLLFNKDINNIPSIEDFGKQKVILTMKYNYKWPDGTNLPVATEEIVETLWVFFQVDDKNISQDPPHFGFASYWHSSAQPNWFEYWRQIEFMEQPPFESNKARYIPELRLDQYGAYYIQEPKYYIYANCAYHGYAMEEGVIVVDTTGRRKPPEHLLAELYDFKAMVFLCYHENFHRTKFVEWWAKGGDENNAYANWLQDQNLPPDLRQDRDGDKIPNNIEIELDLDPRKNLTNNNNFLTDDFEWLAYYNHKRWIDDINSDQKYILNDWAYPGNQTK